MNKLEKDRINQENKVTQISHLIGHLKIRVALRSNQKQGKKRKKLNKRKSNYEVYIELKILNYINRFNYLLI